MKTDLKDAQTALSELKDPFSKDCITELMTHCWVGWQGEWKYSGYVEFTNGNTEGKQTFEGTSLADLLKKMEAFTETL